MNKPIAKSWTFASSSGSKTYETLQYEDGSTSCNCFGWCRQVKSDGSRTCKHTRMVESGMADSECIKSLDLAKKVKPPKLPPKPVVEEEEVAEKPKTAHVVRKIQW